MISATRVRTKCTLATLKCRNCGNVKRVPVAGLGGINIPRICDRNLEERGQQQTMSTESCPKDSYMIVPDRCEYVDQQTLKIQESPEVVPTGEMPRNIAVVTDRNLVDKASPGTRVSIIGITSVVNASTKQPGSALRTIYLRVVGIQARLLPLAPCLLKMISRDYSLTKTGQDEQESVFLQPKKNSFMKWRAIKIYTASWQIVSLHPFMENTRMI